MAFSKNKFESLKDFGNALMSFRQRSVHQGSVSVKVQETVAVASPVAQQVSTRSSSLGVRVGGLSLTHTVEGQKEPTVPLVVFGSPHVHCAREHSLHTPH